MAASRGGGGLEGLPVIFGGGRLALVEERVRPGAVDFKLRVRGGELAGTAAVEALHELRPTLAEHACSADGLEGPDEMTIPHLVEHVAIDLIVERRGASDGAVAGYTAWLDRGSGLARVTLASENPVVTESALLDACGLVAEYLDS